jgi:hypothetical protein
MTTAIIFPSFTPPHQHISDQAPAIWFHTKRVVSKFQFPHALYSFVCMCAALYQPLETLYLILITSKQSNIMEDLDTLRTLAKLVCAAPFVFKKHPRDVSHLMIELSPCNGVANATK